MAIAWLAVGIVGVVLTLVAVPAAAPLSRALGAVSTAGMRVVLLSSVVLICSSMLTSVITAFPIGNRRMVAPNVGISIGAVINFIASVGSIALGAGLPGYALANAGAAVVSVLVVALIVLRAEGPALRPSEPGPGPDVPRLFDQESDCAADGLGELSDGQNRDRFHGRPDRRRRVRTGQPRRDGGAPGRRLCDVGDRHRAHVGAPRRRAASCAKPLSPLHRDCRSHRFPGRPAGDGYGAAAPAGLALASAAELRVGAGGAVRRVPDRGLHGGQLRRGRGRWRAVWWPRPRSPPRSPTWP